MTSISNKVLSINLSSHNKRIAIVNWKENQTTESVSCGANDVEFYTDKNSIDIVWNINTGVRPMWHSESNWEHQWAYRIGGHGVKAFVRIESESLWPEISAAIALPDGLVNGMMIRSVRTFEEAVSGIPVQYLVAEGVWKVYALQRLDITIDEFIHRFDYRFHCAAPFTEVAGKVINNEINTIISFIRGDVRSLDKNDFIATQYIRHNYRWVSRLTNDMLCYKLREKENLKLPVRSFLFDTLLAGLTRLSIFLESEFHKYIDPVELLSVPTRNIMVHNFRLMIPQICDRYAGIADATLILRLLKPLDEVVYNSGSNIIQKRALFYKRYVEDLMSVDLVASPDEIIKKLNQIYLLYFRGTEG